MQKNRVKMRTVVRDVNGSTKPFNPKLRIFPRLKVKFSLCTDTSQSVYKTSQI